jgi:3-oxoadipate enol-lactonase
MLRAIARTEVLLAVERIWRRRWWQQCSREVDNPIIYDFSCYRCFLELAFEPSEMFMPVLTVNGVRTYFRLEGRENDPCLVLVHAIGTDHSLWDAVVAELQGVRVLRIDLRGHGGSEVAPGPYTLEELASDLLSITSDLRLEEFSVVGVSLGAMVAAQAAALAPDRVRGLGMCSVAPRIGPPPGGWDQRARAVLDSGMAPLVPGMLSRMFSPAWLKGENAQTATLETVFRFCAPSGYASCCAVLRDADLANILPDVRCPSLILCGAEDQLVQPAAAKAVADLAPHGRVVTFESGHYPMIEQPHPFASAVAAFAAPHDDP